MKYELVIKSKKNNEVIDVALVASESAANRYVSEFFDGFDGDKNEFYYELYVL